MNFKVTNLPSYHILTESARWGQYENLISLLDGFWEDRIKLVSHDDVNPKPDWFDFNFRIPTSLKSYTQDREQLLDASPLFFLLANNLNIRLIRHTIDRIVDFSFVDDQSGVSAFSLALLSNNREAVDLMLSSALKTSAFYRKNRQAFESHDWRTQHQK